MENIQKILKFDYQKKSELGLIFIPREALKKINRLLVKKLKIETHIKYHSQVTPALALSTAMKKNIQHRQINWDLFLYTQGRF